MKKRNIARRRGTSVAAAALSFALVAPLAQPVAGAQEATPGEVENQPADGAANPESSETGTPNESDPDADWDGGGDGPREESPRPDDVPESIGGVEVVWADAIANKYIRTSTGLTNSRSLSGRAFEVTEQGNFRPTSNGQRGVPEGTTVYMQLSLIHI